MIRSFCVLAVLLTAGCTDRVLLGERDTVVVDASSADGALIDATPIVIDAPPEEPDAEGEMHLCTCCCPEGEGPGTCPELCGCVNSEDCPADYECAPNGEEMLFCVLIPI